MNRQLVKHRIKDLRVWEEKERKDFVGQAVFCPTGRTHPCLLNLHRTQSYYKLMAAWLVFGIRAM